MLGNRFAEMGGQCRRLARLGRGKPKDIVQSSDLARLAANQRFVQAVAKRFGLFDAPQPTVSVNEIGDLYLQPLFLGHVLDRFDDPRSIRIELFSRQNHIQQEPRAALGE